MDAYYVDVFATEPGQGNPAAVVIAPGLSGTEMGQIAARLGLETTFADGERLHYYLPAGEPMALCGHGTLAALSVMGRQGQFAVVTPVGALTVQVRDGLLGMAMPPVTFGDPVEPALAARALGIDPAAIDGLVLPAGAGRPKLLVPLRSVSVLDGIVPDQAAVAEACRLTGTTGLYPYTCAVRRAGAAADARQFPAGGGLLEDPVTGVAAVALARYLWKEGLAPAGEVLAIDQGHAMGRPGRVLVSEEDDGQTWIYGHAATGRRMEV